jgi:mono/diheme cytochrome c family protein
MREALALFALSGTVIVGGASAQTEAPMPGVGDVRQAQIDYKLKCQGCHRPDGRGDAISNPPMNGKVARFLSVPGGREFLGRVPGVATVDLNDARLADVLNWTLYRFDRANLPKDFAPYTAAEVATLRKTPLRTERETVRKELVAQMRAAKF